MSAPAALDPTEVALICRNLEAFLAHLVYQQDGRLVAPPVTPGDFATRWW